MTKDTMCKECGVNTDFFLHKTECSKAGVFQ